MRRIVEREAGKYPAIARQHRYEMPGFDQWLDLAFDPEGDAGAVHRRIKRRALIIEGQRTGHRHGKPNALVAKFPIIQGVMTRPTKADAEMGLKLARMERNLVVGEVGRGGNRYLSHGGLKREGDDILIEQFPKPYPHVEPLRDDIQAGIVDFNLHADSRKTAHEFGQERSQEKVVAKALRMDPHRSRHFTVRCAGIVQSRFDLFERDTEPSGEALPRGRRADAARRPVQELNADIAFQSTDRLAERRA